MALEDLTGPSKFIDDLDEANPVGSTDEKREGDDHIRGVKNVLKNTIGSLTGAVTATHTELNLLDGCTSTTADLNLLAGIAAASRKVINFAAGTGQLFYADVAPTDWTIVTAVDEHMVRLTGGDDVVGSETGGTTGGTNNFDVQFTDIDTGGHAISIAEMPAHDHTGSTPASVITPVGAGAAVLAAGSHGSANLVIASQGGGGTHDHTVDLKAKHANCIIATLDA